MRMTRQIPDHSRPWLVAAVVTLAVLLAGQALAARAESETIEADTPAEIYRAACANCHGADGSGAPSSRLGFNVPVPDFTDCNFASREPDADWVAVAHAGGPVRGFSQLMPAFGGILSVEQLEMAVAHIRTFCDDDWPPGHLNLPRPLVTEKAYPEDEAVLTTTFVSEGPTEGLDSIHGEIVYEQRFGVRNQLELVVPFAWNDRLTGPDASPDDSDWSSSVGDIALGVKRAVWHDGEQGSILSVTGEIILPTGDEEAGTSSGTAIFEPFVSYGQILPADLFLHGQAGVGVPFDSDEADEEAFLRVALGRSFVSGQWGRTWSPMVELLGERELASGADTNWDIAPQIQITLNTRQHIMLNVGVRTPLNNEEGRDTEVIAYLLWDWFDGSFFAGW